MPIIHWFRRDLRLADNTALYHAARDSADGTVVPAFIFDDAILRHPDTGAPIVAFMLDCLRELRLKLRAAGGELVLLHGVPLEELRALARKTGASAVYFNKDYAPSAVERDVEIERALPRDGIAVKAFKDQVIFEEQEILSASKGEPYTVYTPYSRAWRKQLELHWPGGRGPEPLATPKLRFPAKLPTSTSSELPTARKLIGIELKHRIDIPAGEDAAAAMLQRFCAESLASYRTTRNIPAMPYGTSRLSPHLRHGTLSPRQCIRAALDAARDGNRTMADGADTWIGELIWREFYQQILFNFPRVEREPFKEKMARIRWREDDRELACWQAGLTGFPIVDAAMRQLAQSGWMHNRLRMIVAMFLTKDLLIDYRHGERWFMQNLIDGETAQNNGGWQWSAGTGTDAQPYFRIFNPASQSARVDPRGAFIRKYCPELAGVPDTFIHEPHRMSGSEQRDCGCRIGRDYPKPVVDHDRARKRALHHLSRP